VVNNLLHAGLEDRNEQQTAPCYENIFSHRPPLH
jgi:hypothetical protein